MIQEQPLGPRACRSVASSRFSTTDEDAIAVLLPDDLVLPRGVLEIMARVRAKRGGSVLCAIDVPKDAVSAYGRLRRRDRSPTRSIPTSSRSSAWSRSRLWKTRRRPLPLQVAICSIVRSSTHLRRIEPGAGGELQLTDAIALLISEGHPVHVVVHRGTRHDLGNPGGYLRASVDLALDSGRLRPGPCVSGSRIGLDR